MDVRTGAPFWLRRGGIPRSYPTLREDISADVVIVGAGITGALVAYELSGRGIDIVVVDRADVATASTAASTGLLQYDTDSSLRELSTSIGEAGAVRAYHAGQRAIDHLERVTNELRRSCGFARRPTVYFASTKRDVPRLEEEFEARRRHGFAVEWLTKAGLADRCGIAAPAAIVAHGAGEVDPYRLTHALLARCEQRGVRIFDRVAVSTPSRDGERSMLRTDRGHSISATHVVWATGYEAEDMVHKTTAQLASTWVVVSEPLEHFRGWWRRALLWETARPYVYVRSTDDGRLLIGGEDEPCAECHRSPWWFRTKSRRLLERARRLFPQFDIDMAYAWAGTFATTTDGLPYVGQVRERPGVWFAMGYGGNGITFSVVTSRIIRDGITGVPNADATLFGLDRPKA